MPCPYHSHSTVNTRRVIYLVHFASRRWTIDLFVISHALCILGQLSEERAFTFTCIESFRCYSLLSQSVAYAAGFFFSLALFVTNHFSCLNRLRNFRARDIIRFCSQLMFEQFCFFFFFLLVVAKSTRQYPGHASIKYYNFHHLFVHRYIYIYILFSYAFWLASVSREQLRATLSLTHIHAPLLIISYSTFSLLSIYI